MDPCPRRDRRPRASIATTRRRPDLHRRPSGPPCLHPTRARTRPRRSPPPPPARSPRSPPPRRRPRPPPSSRSAQLGLRPKGRPGPRSRSRPGRPLSQIPSGSRKRALVGEKFRWCLVGPRSWSRSLGGWPDRSRSGPPRPRRRAPPRLQAGPRRGTLRHAGRQHPAWTRRRARRRPRHVLQGRPSGPLCPRPWRRRGRPRRRRRRRPALTRRARHDVTKRRRAARRSRPARARTRPRPSPPPPVRSPRSPTPLRRPKPPPSSRRRWRA